MVSSYSYTFANFGGVALASGIWFGLGNTWAGFVALIVFYIVFTAIAIMNLETDSVKEGMYVLAFENVMDLRAELEPVIGWVPIAWCFLIKHFIPQVLLILFVNGASAKIDSADGPVSKFGNYEGELSFFLFEFI